MKLYHPDQPKTVTISGKSYRIGFDNTYDVPDEHVRAFKQQGFVCAGRYLATQAKANTQSEPESKPESKPEPEPEPKPEPDLSQQATDNGNL